MSRNFTQELDSGISTEFTQLTPVEQKFVTAYIKSGNAAQAAKDVGLVADGVSAYTIGRKLLKKPNIKKEIALVMESLKSETVATAQEVMSYFTSVMRGELKDQFGLDAPLSERTKAAQELAKRTIDLDNRGAMSSPDIQVTLNWARDKEGEN